MVLLKHVHALTVSSRRKPLIPSSADSLRAMGQRGRERVLAEFSREKMTESLDREIQRLCQSPRSAVNGSARLLYLALFSTALFMAILAGVLGVRPAKNIITRT